LGGDPPSKGGGRRQLWTVIQGWVSLVNGRYQAHKRKEKRFEKEEKKTGNCREAKS